MTSKIGASSKGKKSVEPRPSRTLLLFDAIVNALEDRIRLTAAKRPSPPLIASSLTGSFGINNDENTHSSWLACLQIQLENVAQLSQRYNWVLSQRQNATVREAQLLAGHEAILIGASDAERRRTLANMLQAIRSDVARMDAELYSTEMRVELLLLGFLECNIHGLAGFARLSPGSIFCLTLKHADQKWQSRVTTGKYNKQYLENDVHRFKIVLDYSLGIKAEEERSFGAGGGSSASSTSGSSTTSEVLRSLVPRALLPRRLIGTVNFDILPLISALPQLLTISLNPSGSLKLHIIVKWLPPPPPPDATSLTEAAGMLALELRSTADTVGMAAPATFAARSGRRNMYTSPKYGKGMPKTVRQHRSMSLHPRDVGVLLSELAIKDTGDNEGGTVDYGIHGGQGRSTDPSVVSSISPIPSLTGSNPADPSRHASWSWLKNVTASPRSDVDYDGSGGTLSRSFQPRPGAGLDRIRALALHDLNSSADAAHSDRMSSAAANKEQSAAITVSSKDAIVISKVNVFETDMSTLHEVIEAINVVLEEIRGRWNEVNEFEESFLLLRDHLAPFTNSSSQLSKKPGIAGNNKVNSSLAPRTAPSIRQSMRRRKNHLDLQVNVEPSLTTDEVATKKGGVSSTGWPELDTAISSHTRRSLEDLRRLASVSFLPSEIGYAARETVLESLRRHAMAFRQVFVPLMTTTPSNRPTLALEIVTALLPSVDSHSLWSALARSSSGLVAIPAVGLQAEIVKRISASRSLGPVATYAPSPNAVADRVLSKITQYYGEFVYGTTVASIARLSSACQNVITLVDFALFAGNPPGVIARLEELNEEMRFCFCLDPAIVRRHTPHDDSIYASALQATRRRPSPMLVHALASAAASNGRCTAAVVAALRSASPEWCQALINCVGSVLLWMSAAESKIKDSTEAIESRLAFVCLLRLLSTESTAVSTRNNVQSTIASILAQLAVYDSDNGVRAAARTSAISMGQMGLTILSKTDRSANAFQGFGMATAPAMTRNSSGEVEEIFEEI